MLRRLRPDLRDICRSADRIVQREHRGFICEQDRRSSDATDNRGAPMKSIREKRDELTLKLPIREAEMMGLRQLLAEVKASRD